MGWAGIGAENLTLEDLYRFGAFQSMEGVFGTGGKSEYWRAHLTVRHFSHGIS